MADNALGRFLRARREATPPPSTAGRRRTPGLRRGELADRAGISVEYLTRLERGTDRSPPARSSSPSPTHSRCPPTSASTSTA
ncbi:helix-turn-helix domain-containing protein [Lentzea atacamensis]|uniref:helix-turn-helix domain-containing protein n=1 Tax=Lentzea atacamensis TaxID=531938 RepID=UPI001F2C5FC4|nr:helix-turn-helix transcriptional regulator [Lentzea atacamensis]